MANRKRHQFLTQVYDRYFDDVYKYVSRRVQGKDAINSVVQKIFQEACASHESLIGQATSPLVALYKLASWHAGRSEGTPKQQDLYEVLKQLDEEEREVLRLRFLENLSDAEIAEVMNFPLEQMSVKMFQAMQKVKNLLD